MSRHDDLLDAFKAYPTGDAAQWLARYEPLIRQTRRFVTHDQTPHVSIIAVGWRRPQALLQALDHARQQRGLTPAQLELILVDNGGLHDAYDEIARRVSVHVQLRVNARHCIGRNIGAALAQAPVLCFIDDDGLIRPDYAACALARLAEPGVVAVRSRIVAKDHRYFTTLASHYDRGQDAVEDCLVTEGSMAIWRDAFLQVGGFAEALFGHEGIDLTFRLKRRDPQARVLYAPDMIMAHDYMDGWVKFIKKSSHYSGINDALASRDPELERFMSDYFARRFTRQRARPDEALARLALLGTRALLQQLARQRAR